MLKTMAPPAALLIIFLLSPAAARAQQTPKTETHVFGFPFNQSYYNIFSVVSPASISNNALQITPDSLGNFTLTNRSGRVLYNHPFTLWDDNNKLASFNTSFILNIYHANTSATPGEGVAFIVTPDLSIPLQSDGEYLGLTNSTTDGLSRNRLFAVEFDTNKQEFDPDGNHIGIDTNSVRSNKTVSLSPRNITLASNGTVFHKVWINYNGIKKSVAIYIADKSESTDTVPMPASPVLTMDGLDLTLIVAKQSFFGFSASTGSHTEELHCVLSWNMTVEVIGETGGNHLTWMIVFGVVMVAAVAMVAGVGVGGLLWWRRKRKRAGDPNLLGTLKRLPGTPREFEFRDLKKATGNFDEKNKLGQGGYGVVFKGVLAVENNAEVAVKMFTREDNLKCKDDFLCELAIINRLRHKHLVKLLGWCHKNGMLLLVYEYMPNGSLDRHIFCGEGQEPIGWEFRYKILQGAASAVQYLHYEYEETVIHRDLKANNILLDTDFNARLGDFGLARALDQEKTSYAEMEGVHGTMGYIAPECFHTGKATRESDVYAFGVVLLEVACGHRPWAKLGGFHCLVDWVWSLHRESKILEAVDYRLAEEYDPEEAERVLLLGLACVHPMRAERPKTHTIVQILSRSVPVPPVPPFKSAFVWPAMGPVDDSDMSMTADSIRIESSHYESKWTPRSYARGSFEDYTDRSTV